MQTSLQHPRGRRRPRNERARLVCISDLIGTASGFSHEEEEEAYAAGLESARLLRLHFPEVYAAHIEGMRVTPATMLATMELFINLAKDRLFFVDVSHGELNLWSNIPPLAQFERTLEQAQEDERQGQAHEIIDAICRDRHFIWDPIPQVYGLDRNPDYLDPVHDPFAVAVWRLLVNTAMATIREHKPDSLAKLVGINTPAGQVISKIQPLPEGTDVESLCQELDCIVPQGVKHLGSAILYVAGMTGNQYADTSYEELMDWYGCCGIEWDDPVNLAEILEAQVEAREIVRCFDAVNALFRKNPAQFSRVFSAIHRIAREQRQRKPEPKSLMELYAPRERQVSHLGEVYVPIDISRKTEVLEDLGLEVLGPVLVLSATNPEAFGYPALHHPAGDAPAAAGGGDPAG